LSIEKDAYPILRSDTSVFGLQLFFCKRKSQEMSCFPAAHFLAHYNNITPKIGFQRKNHANFMHLGDVWAFLVTFGRQDIRSII
jgi:hypothetical protein